MTAIWKNGGSDWKLLAPSEYPDEATLHTLVEEAPQMLPLSGNPQFVIIGREVQLGTGYADLLGIEANGRPVLIEIKLNKNAEARRAVVAQVLAYASYLYGLDTVSLERDVLGKHLVRAGHESLTAAVVASDQAGDFDPEEFEAGLSASLAEGRFRLVFVLDDAPDELGRLVNYLESIGDKVLIDLITISSYKIGESTIIVPQRVDPERSSSPGVESSRKAKAEAQAVRGPEDFIAKIEAAPAEERPKLKKLAEWAKSLERDGLCQLYTVHGISNRWILQPRLLTDNVGLVTIWNEGGGYVSFWRSVLERRAPKTLPLIEKLVAPTAVGQGNTTREIPDALLDLLTKAYREAKDGTA